MKRKLTTTLGLLFAALFSASAAAVPLTDLFAGASIIAGDKLFDQWTLNLVDSSNDAFDPDLSLIDVTPLSDGGNDPGPGLAYNAGTELDLTGDSFFSFIDLSFGFRVSTLGGGLIKDNSLTLQQAVVTLTGNNGSFIEESVGTSPGLDDLASKLVEFSFLEGLGTTQITTDTADFLPQSELFVTTNILIFADADERAGIFGFEQRFSQVARIPEPASLGLMTLGLLLALRRRLALN